MELLARREKMLPQAHSLLPFIVFNKASLLIQRGKRREEPKKGGEKRRERGSGVNRKASQSSFEFHLIFLWELRAGKKINYGAHLNIISSTQPPTRCPSPRKPNYSANLSLADAVLLLSSNERSPLRCPARLSPQTSTVTVTPPSLMLVPALPSTTTLSSWSHGTPSAWITFSSSSISKYTYWLPFLFLNQVRQRVWIQQPCLRPDGTHGCQGVKRPANRRHCTVTSPTFSLYQILTFNSKTSTPVRCLKEKSHKEQKRFKLVTNYFFVLTSCSVLVWWSWRCESLSVVLKYCSQWNKVLFVRFMPPSYLLSLHRTNV